MHLAVQLWLCKASCDNRAGSKQENQQNWGRWEGVKNGGKQWRGIACVWLPCTYIHMGAYTYVFVCKSLPLCVWALRLPGKWMCWPHQSLQLVERLRKRRLGSRPVRGEFASVLPWRWTASGFCWMKMDGSEMGGKEGSRVGGWGKSVCLCVPGFRCVCD